VVDFSGAQKNRINVTSTWEKAKGQIFVGIIDSENIRVKYKQEENRRMNKPIDMSPIIR
jgi:hypothetical protein